MSGVAKEVSQATYRGKPLGQCSNAELVECALLAMGPADPTTLGGWEITKLNMAMLPQVQRVMLSRRSAGATA